MLIATLAATMLPQVSRAAEAAGVLESSIDDQAALRLARDILGDNPADRDLVAQLGDIFAAQEAPNLAKDRAETYAAILELEKAGASRAPTPEQTTDTGSTGSTPPLSPRPIAGAAPPNGPAIWLVRHGYRADLEQVLEWQPKILDKVQEKLVKLFVGSVAEQRGISINEDARARPGDDIRDYIREAIPERDSSDFLELASKVFDTANSDTPLSVRGRRQALFLSRFFEDLPEHERPRHVFTSPFLRAMQTAVPTATALNLKMMIEPAFMEAGVKITSCHHKQLEEELRRENMENFNKHHATCGYTLRPHQREEEFRVFVDFAYQPLKKWDEVVPEAGAFHASARTFDAAVLVREFVKQKNESVVIFGHSSNLARLSYYLTGHLPAEVAASGAPQDNLQGDYLALRRDALQKGWEGFDTDLALPTAGIVKLVPSTDGWYRPAADLPLGATQPRRYADELGGLNTFTSKGAFRDWFLNRLLQPLAPIPGATPRVPRPQDVEARPAAETWLSTYLAGDVQRAEQARERLAASAAPAEGEDDEARKERETDERRLRTEIQVAAVHPAPQYNDLVQRAAQAVRTAGGQVPPRRARGSGEGAEEQCG